MQAPNPVSRKHADRCADNNSAEAIESNKTVSRVLMQGTTQGSTANLRTILCARNGDEQVPRKLSEKEEHVTCFKLNTFCM